MRLESIHRANGENAASKMIPRTPISMSGIVSAPKPRRRGLNIQVDRVSVALAMSIPPHAIQPNLDPLTASAHAETCGQTWASATPIANIGRYISTPL